MPEDTAVLQNIPHSNCCKKVPNRPLRPPQRPIWNTFGTVAERDCWENGCTVEEKNKEEETVHDLRRRQLYAHIKGQTHRVLPRPARPLRGEGHRPHPLQGEAHRPHTRLRDTRQEWCDARPKKTTDWPKNRQNRTARSARRRGAARRRPKPDVATHPPSPHTPRRPLSPHRPIASR